MIIGPASATWTQDDPLVPLITVPVAEHDQFPSWTFVFQFDGEGRVTRFEAANDQGGEVTTTWLRALPFETIRREAAQFRRDELRDMAENKWGPLKVSDAVGEHLRGAAEPGGEERLLRYAETARDYLRKCSGERPAKDLSAELFISVRALQKRLKVAEELGLFVPAGPGKSGGSLTRFGVAVLEQNGEAWS